MKAGMMGIITVIVLVLLGVTVFHVSGREIRKSELDKSLTNAIEQTMQAVYLDKSYPARSQEDLIADFTGNMLVQFASNSNVEVHILGIDFENGCLDIKGTEKFRYFTGREGKISIRKTVIFEQFKDPNDIFYDVKFLNEDKTLYKELKVYHGGKLKEPGRPSRFIRWELWGDASWNGDFSNLAVTKDMVFQAICG